jgi:CRP/FNR family transcriptional regulator, nitrogen oxide reductase regulator
LRYLKLMASTVVTQHTLSQIPLLADLPPELAERLSRELRVRELVRGDALFNQGDKAQAVFAVLAGRLRLMQHTLEGQDVALSVFAPGDLIGLVAMLGGEDYPGMCEAQDDSTVLTISGSTFHELLEQHPPLAMRMIRLLVRRLHEAHDQVRELAAERVERRVARTVLRLANKVGVKTEHGIRIDMPLSRQDLAELCGTTLHTVSRILSEWQRAGLVDVGRETVTVVRAHALVLIAEELADRPA